MPDQNTDAVREHEHGDAPPDDAGPCHHDRDSDRCERERDIWSADEAVGRDHRDLGESDAEDEPRTSAQQRADGATPPEC
jgi:hypothetical protein